MPRSETIRARHRTSRTADAPGTALASLALEGRERRRPPSAGGEAGWARGIAAAGEAEEKKMITLDTRKRTLARCLEDCATRADQCAESALGMPQARACVSACRDTAALCRLAAELLVRESTMTSLMLPICDLACATCADACEEHFDSALGDCARRCRRQCRAVQRAMDQLQRREGLSAQPA